MSSTQDITKKQTATSLGAVCEPQPENHTRAGRASCEEYQDLITHHNERPRKERPEEQQEPQTDPAPVKDHEPETEENPFLEWDGEEGQPPHN